jgi:PAS domain S-box-containing protein
MPSPNSIPVEWTAVDSPEWVDAASASAANTIARIVVNTGKTLAVNDWRDLPELKAAAHDLSTIEAYSVLAVPCESDSHATGGFDSRIQGVLILYECGKARGFSEETVVFVENIAAMVGTALKHSRSQEVLNKSHDRYRATVYGSSEAVLHVNLSGRVVAASRSFSELTGLAVSSLIGRPFTGVIDEFVLSEDSDSVLEYYHRAQVGQAVAESFNGRIKDQRDHQIRSVTMYVSSMCNADNEGVGYQFRLTPATAKTEAEVTDVSDPLYQRLVEHSDAIIFHADWSHQLAFVSRRAMDFFGVSPEDFIGQEETCWFDLIHPEDRNRVREVVLRSSESVAPFDEEFRVVNQMTGHVRWVLARVVPVRAEDGRPIGWDGFAFDITLRREAQEALEIQSKKVRALYTVASAIRGYLDPANIASRGLAALCDATGADAGLCYLYPAGNRNRMELVAHHGFSAQFAGRVNEVAELPSLSNYVAAHGKSVVVADLNTDSRASRILAEDEGLQSAVLVPIFVDDQILGSLGLFSRSLSRFHGGDVMLVSAAANQIGLAARQARLFSAYRKQTKNLAALYRMSHELSGNLTLDDIFQHAFSVIRDELGLKRLWLGLVNESGTRIVGQAAYGPGWKRRLVHMNLDITGKDHPLAKVVSERKPIVIDDSADLLKEFGIRRIFSRLAIHSVVLLPLVSGGQVLGALAVQPRSGESSLDPEDMTLLLSLGNEIAAIVLTKRLEGRIAEGEKMRAAGLLAAGIAHNFNNLLQAVLGQASLMEMQADEPERVGRSARIIKEAANRGAALVKQLVSFAQLEEPVREACDSTTLVRRAIDAFKGKLKDNVSISTDLPEGLPKVHVDTAQIMRVLNTLISNATEAMHDRGVVEVFCDALEVDRASPHYEVPYGKYVRIGVRDFGVGMDEETRKRCFEPFFTTKNVDAASGVGMTGSGLGLAAAYALARRNGGRIVVDSREAEGTLFTLYLPAMEHAKDEPKLEDRIEREQSAEEGISTKDDSRGELGKVSPRKNQESLPKRLSKLSNSDGRRR